MNYLSIPLEKRYIPAVVIIAIFIISTSLINIYSIEKNKSIGKIINLMGEQRMLSQRLIILAVNHDTMNTKNTKIELINAIAKMKGNHQFLLTKLFTKNLNNIYYRDTFHVELNNYIRKFEDFIEEKNSEYIFEARLNSLYILNRLDEISYEFEIYGLAQLENAEIIEIMLTVLTLLVLIFIVLYIFKPTSIKIKNNHLNLEKTNFSLEDELRLKIENLEEQKMRLLNSDKMVSMGEMLGNISHQWKQPLSLISANSSAIILRKELNTLPDDILINYCETIIKNSEYLSNTIEVFTNFITNDKFYKKLILQDEINNALIIVSSHLIANNITLKKNMNYEDNIYVEMFTGELQQVIINIINNAKDILLERNTRNPVIELKVREKNDKILITIKDNAGGIPNDIISKIFDPYFSTKEKSIGTGLGLHMSYKIIVESLKGELYVKNRTNGAKFYIVIPGKINFSNNAT